MTVNKMKNQKFKLDGYGILLIMLGLTFFWISFISFHMSSLKWEHIFDGACSILGGTLTLIGVKQTIEWQSRQDQLKLIPTKLIKLHALEDLATKLNGEFEKKVLEIKYDLYAGFKNISEGDDQSMWGVVMNTRDSLNNFVKEFRKTNEVKMVELDLSQYVGHKKVKF
jgi:hypothetical protein